MPTSAADTEITYIGNGVTIAFPFPFEISKASHFEATIDGAVVTAYTLSGLGVDTGGTCSFTDPPDSLAEIVLARVAPYARTDFDYQEGGELAANTLDEDNDRGVMLSQQLATTLKRVPQVKRGDLTKSLTLTPEANKLLAWDGSAGGLTNVDVADVTPTGVVMSALGQQVVTAATKPALIALIGSQSHGLANLSLAFSAAGNALTIALKGHDGNDLSAASTGFAAFRNVTASSGDVDILDLSAPLSLTISSGAILGVLSNNEPFRIWVVLFNDDGVARLGVMRPLSYDASTLYSNPVPSVRGLMSAGGLASATAMNSGADSSQTFYASTTVTAKPYAVLGFFEYNAGLAAIGAWAIVPTAAAIWTPGMPLPGEVVKANRRNEGEMLSGGTALPFDDTIPTNAEGNQFLALPFTSDSRPNLHRIRGIMNVASSGTAASIAGTICEATLTDALAVVSAGRDGSANAQAQLVLDHAWVPTMAVPSYTLRAGNSAGTITLNGSAAARQFGGRMVSFIEINEIMV